MKKIGEHTKAKVLQLFLQGLLFDEIVTQLGIAKGSVVNTVESFRNGTLPTPPGMSEYIDELRHLVVDLKKHQLGVTQVKSCLRIHNKLEEMGVRTEQVEDWLETSQDIASNTLSSSQFVQIALELADLKSQTGLSYQALIDEYRGRLEDSKALDIEIEQKHKELEKLSSKCKAERSQAAKELEALTKAIAIAQKNFAKQTEYLKAQLDEYLARNRLSWEEVKMVTALLNSVLSDAGLEEKEIDKLSSQITAAGSLATAIRKLGKQRDGLKYELDRLVREKGNHASEVNRLRAIVTALAHSLEEKRREGANLDAEMRSRRVTVYQLDRKMASLSDEMQVNRLITKFLASPDLMTNNDFERLFSQVVSIRKLRRGLEPRQIRDESGRAIYEFERPGQEHRMKEFITDTDRARELLASYLMPLVVDYFVLKRDQ